MAQKNSQRIQKSLARSFTGTPIIFATNLPVHIITEQLQETFKSFGDTHITITKGDGDESCIARIEFKSIAIAEKALAVMHLRPIPDIMPPVFLRLSISDQFPLGALTSAHPRLVKRQLPSHLTDLQLYNLLRPFGRIAHVFIDKDVGENVQFWTEDEACFAEAKVRKAFAHSTEMTLRPYDPCILFCSNLSRSMDTEALKGIFNQFGAIVSASVSLNQRGKSRCFGFVTYKIPGQALLALKSTNGKLFMSKRMSVQFHDPSHQPESGSTPPNSISTKTPATRNEESYDSDQDDSSSTTSTLDTYNDPSIVDPIADKMAAYEADIASLQRELKKLQDVITGQDKLIRKMKEDKIREEAEKARMKAELEESQHKIRELLAQQAEFERIQKDREEAERRAKAEAERKFREEEDRNNPQGQTREHIRMNRWRDATENENTRCRQRDSDMRGHTRWNNTHALNRFKLLLDEFDKAKFSEEKPLSPWIIPWPMVHFPSEMQDMILEWGHVEAFFAYVQTQMSTMDYKALLEKAHRLFHPDKWHSRRILDTVMDAEIRMLLGKTGNIVSQALTPLWRASKGYD